MSTTHGRCLCGAVTFEVSGPFELMSHCHCTRCRKTHGTAFGTYVMCAPEAFRLTSGREHIGRYESSPGFGRPFCTQCGSTVPDGEPFEGRVAMPAGILDDDPGVRPLAHIFTGSKASWYDIVDDLPSFEGYPPGFGGPPLGELPAASSAGDAVTGSCLCGGVAYEASGEPMRCALCHCSRCRKANAAAHGANVVLLGDGLRFVRGVELVQRYAVPDAARFAHHFCRVCSASMPRVLDAIGMTVVPLGSIDSLPDTVRPQMHIFVGSKAPWYEIAGTLPQYDTYPG